MQQSKLVEIYDNMTFELLEVLGVESMQIDIDSVASENGEVVTVKAPTNAKLFDIVNIIDTAFNQYYLGYIKEIIGNEIMIADLKDNFTIPNQVMNTYDIPSIEQWLVGRLTSSYINNSDPQQAKPYYAFSAATSTTGSLIFENLEDGKEKVVPYNQLFDKLAKEYNIYVTYSVDYNNWLIRFKVSNAPNAEEIFIDTSLSDVREFDVGVSLQGYNKVDLFDSDSQTGQINLASYWVLLNDGTVSQDLNHVDRVNPPCNPGYKTFSTPGYNPQEEALKFFRTSFNAANEITFKIRKDSKIYANQAMWEIGNAATIKHEGRLMDTIITGKSIDSRDEDYVSYLCGFKRTSLTKQLQRGGI